MLNGNSRQPLSDISEEFRLRELPGPVDLKALARSFGATSIEEREIESEAILLPNKNGHRIILKKASGPGRRGRQRQRFSLAHELGHLLLRKSGLQEDFRSAIKCRGQDYSNEEERVCDRIAAEILMPQLAFEEDGWREGWSLRSLRTLAGKYDTSIPTTAVRMIDLMPEEALMGVWKLSDEDGSNAKLQWSRFGRTAYRVPSPGAVANQSLSLIRRAWNSGQVESGLAPVRLGSRAPPGCPCRGNGLGQE